MKPTSKEVIDELSKILDATPKEIKGFMTPKEKAEELVDKYDGLLTYIESKGKAKDCAMASVEEILDSIWVHLHLHQMDFWRDVKKEIRKI